jgi:hypothetical protein
LDFFLCQSLSAEKENGAVFHFHFIDISWLALDDYRSLALFSPESDKDLFSHGKTCHKNLAAAGYLLLNRHAGPLPSHENASINLRPETRERLMEG